jgi:hypothetical protein
MKNRPGVVLLTLLLCTSMLVAQTPQQPQSQQPSPSGPAAAPTNPPGAGAQKPATPEPPKDKAFADVVKDAQVIKGLFTMYRTDEKVFLEILPEQLEKVYLVSLTVDSGIGERGFYAAAMAGEAPLLFHKQGKNVQLIVKNTRFHADNGPMQRAVGRSFSDSILGITKIESLPHPERKSILIDFGALVLTDLPMLSYDLESTFRIPYRFDAKNSVFGTLKAFPQNVEVETIAHYATERPPLPPLLAPGQPPPPLPPPPANLPDVRSMLFHLRYSISERPQTGYRPRIADQRVGHFVNSIEDYSDDDRYSTTKRFVNRWHLVKKDPSAALSPPKQPVVYWLENTIPLKYRDAIRDGILMWNKAFEKIGFQNAIEVKVQPDDADWDPADSRYSTIRWFAGYPDPGFAQGPSRTDPGTGQIYDADIRFSEAMTRFFRREAHEQIYPLAAAPWEYSSPRAFVAPWSTINASYQCDFAGGAVRDAEFAFDLLVGRGMDPNGAEADKFIKDFLREISAHEVGHTLGLRHNFRASTIHTLEKAQDASVTARDGLTGSVMDYIPTNIAARGAAQGEYHQSILGPYDYWAIEYAYKPIDSPTMEGELTELRKIASRAAEPQLAYDTDEDAGFGPGLDMDPVVNRFDLGTDPLKYYAHRVGLAREIWSNMEQRLEKPGEGYQILRRSFNSALGQTGQALFLTSKYIGGMYHYRSHVGDPGNRIPFEPVSAQRQKQALQLLRDNLFAPTAFQFKPQLLNKLENERFIDFNNFTPSRQDVPIHQAVLNLQRQVLDRIFLPMVLSRIQDSELRVASTVEPFTLGLLFTEIQDSIWAETKAPGASLNINSYRRSLQREHLRRMIGMVLRDAAAPEDARTLARQSLVTLRGQLQRTASRPGLSTSLEVRAHMAESIARIDEALKANMQRTAF